MNRACTFLLTLSCFACTNGAGGIWIVPNEYASDAVNAQYICDRLQESSPGDVVMDVTCPEDEDFAFDLYCEVAPAVKEGGKISLTGFCR